VESPSITRRQRTFLAPIWIFALLGLAVLAGVFAYYRSAGTTTIVLIRHAEKQLGTIANPPLAPMGEQRAERLARMFGDNSSFGRVSKVYVTATRRSQQTAGPLVRRLAIQPTVLTTDDIATIARQLLRENRGHLALAVGHSNTVPALVAELGGAAQVPPIAEDEYDTMYVVAVPDIGRPQILRLKY
jgi:broad specificity phosphatase PhoE